MSLLRRSENRPTILSPRLARTIGCLAILLLFSPWGLAWNSTKVIVGSDGRLSYPADANGNRIPDFSHAGYKGGGVPLPTIPVVKTISPIVGDNTAHIQAALDEVGALPLQTNGYRGTLLLSAGTYEVIGTLRLRQNGLVLSGAGHGDDSATNTILRRTGTSQAAIIQAGNRDDSFRSEVAGTRSQIVTPFVQVGSRSFDVDNPSLYRVGDPVIVFHPSTQPWLDAVDRGGVTNDDYWRPGEIDLRYHRYITAISGTTITVDAPVFNHLDRSLSQSFLYKYDNTHVLKNLGIEKLQIDIVTQGELTENHAEDAIRFVGAEDSWIRDTTAKHFWHAGVQWEGSTRCTAERCRAIEPHSIVTGSRRYNFSMYHSQLILVQDCFADRARHAYVCNGTSLDAGIVFLNCISDRSLTASEGHRRWGTGFLYDNLVATNRQATDFLGLYNRGTFGTGHGWASAHSVAWNVNAAGGRIYLQKPPTAQNYAIGCFGNVTGNGPFAGVAGHIEGTGQTGLEPRSLYLAQLAERLSGSAVPIFESHPTAQTIATGGSVVLRASVTGAISYQWKLNGVDVPGATDANLLLRNVTAAQAGSYTITATNPSGSSTSNAAQLNVVATSDAGRIVNLAIRSHAGTNDQTLIVGAVVGGTGTSGTKPVLVRAIGPELERFDVTGALADPMLQVLQVLAADRTSLVASNDNWEGSSLIADTAARVGAFELTSATSKDAAVVTTFPASEYTVKVSGVDGTTGIALAEIYDTTVATAWTTSTPRLVNVSARTQVGAGADILIAGFVIGGSTSKTVLIRAVGPELTRFSVTGVLADPKLELFSNSASLVVNDNWSADATLSAAFTAVAAFPLEPSGKDSALLVTLPPGNYTAQVSGSNGGTGVALVELYELP